MYTTDDILQHYGVKGMRWGVVRNSNKPGGADGKPDKKDSKLRKAGTQIGRAGKQVGKAGKKVVTAIKDKNKRRNARVLKLAREHHERNKNKKSYKKIYKRNLKLSRGNADMAAIATRRDIYNKRITLALAVAPVAGKLAAGGIRSAITPDRVRAGKNLVQTLKRSPIRYVDGRTMRNVVRNG